MPITSTSNFTLSTIQQVDIDCSSVRRDASIQQEFAPLIGWIRSVRQRSAVHVTLRYATGRTTGRKLKSVFQSLGCTVSMKTAF